MEDYIYCCENKNNTCEKREECIRCIEVDSHPCKTALFKRMCTKNNNYVLFIKKEGE